jgi:GntR family transcriptional regulator
MTRDTARPAPRLSSPTFSPLYRQIKDFLIRSLEEGEWGPGDSIPSEGELASRFNVSQGTVRKAIDEMAAENLLVRRQGRGHLLRHTAIRAPSIGFCAWCLMMERQPMPLVTLFL